METKYTSGPWRMKGGVILSDSEPGFILSKVCRYNVSGNVSLDEANAKLIAAAPELLEALLLAEKFMNQLETPYFLEEEMVECEHVMSKAIERATT